MKMDRYPTGFSTQVLVPACHVLLALPSCSRWENLKKTIVGAAQHNTRKYTPTKSHLKARRSSVAPGENQSPVDNLGLEEGGRTNLFIISNKENKSCENHLLAKPGTIWSAVRGDGESEEKTQGGGGGVDELGSIPSKLSYLVPSSFGLSLSLFLLLLPFDSFAEHISCASFPSSLFDFLSFPPEIEYIHAYLTTLSVPSPPSFLPLLPLFPPPPFLLLVLPFALRQVRPRGVLPRPLLPSLPLCLRRHIPR